MKNYKTYIDYREAWKKAVNKTPLFPLNVDVELSSACNLKCPFCFLQDKDYKRPKNSFIDKDLAINIIHEADNLGIPAIKLNWRGEPTLHPDFNYITDIAKHCDFYDIIINTNLNCTVDKIHGLMRCTKVIISLDSLNEKTYKKMRKNGKLWWVIWNIEALLLREHKGIVLRRVITKDNIKENFKQDVLDRFGDKVEVSEHYAFDRNSSEAHSLHNVQEVLSRTYCGYPSQRLMIDVDGNAHPCCVDYTDELILGNITEDNIYDIWHCNKIKMLRDELKNRCIFEKRCYKCTSWMAYNHKYRESVNK